MTQFVPLSPTRHRAYRLKPHAGYAFAAGEALVPLVLAELPVALLHLPIALAALDDGFRPAAVLGLTAGHGLHVLRDGSWRGDYIPAQIRAYPFTTTADQAGNAIILIDEASDQLSDDGAHSPLFDDQGAPAQPIASRLEFLKKLAADHRATAAACAALQRHGLIVPWPARIQWPDGEREVQGLFQVDDATFARCAPEVLAELRDCGALLLAYALRFARPQLQRLADLATQPLDPVPAPAAAPGRALDPALAALSTNGTLRLSGL